MADTSVRRRPERRRRTRRTLDAAAYDTLQEQIDRLRVELDGVRQRIDELHETMARSDSIGVKRR